MNIDNEVLTVLEYGITLRTYNIGSFFYQEKYISTGELFELRVRDSRKSLILLIRPRLISPILRCEVSGVYI